MQTQLGIWKRFIRRVSCTLCNCQEYQYQSIQMMSLYSSAEHCEICDMITRTSGARFMTSVSDSCSR